MHLDAHVQVASQFGGLVHEKAVNARARVQGNEGRIHDLGKFHPRPRRQGVARRHHQHQVVVPVALHMQCAGAHVARHDADLRFALGDRVHDVRAGGLLEGDAHLRVGLQVVGQVLGQEHVGGVGVRP